MIYNVLRLYVLLSVNLTSNRFYLDYNATSPFSKSVKRLLREGDLLFGNPSSLHYAGKYANRHIRDTKDYLLKLFAVEKNFCVVFHSGATEGMNFFFKSVLFDALKSGFRPLFLFSTVDHSASYAQKEFLESLGFPVQYFNVNLDGSFNEEQVLSLIAKFGDHSAPYPAVLNFLYVNNETGRIWNLDLAKTIKEKSRALVHVDAVQSVGKIKNWNILDHSLDAYTYSSHKFGALKGTGFTFFNGKFKVAPLLFGGGQQEGLRSGTENVLGIYSTKLALEDLITHQDFSLAQQQFSILKEKVNSIQGLDLLEQDQIDEWTCNTLVVSCPKSDANTLVTAFDLSGVAVSSGSACSSGISQPNRILLNMGYKESFAKSAIRISWDSSFYNEEEWDNVCEKVCSILKRFS